MTPLLQLLIVALLLSSSALSSSPPTAPSTLKAIPRTPSRNASSSSNALPYEKVAAAPNVHLGPIHPSHPIRTNSTADFKPVKSILLHYGELGYEDDAHYGGTINYTTTDPALVVNDFSEIVSIGCDWNGISLILDSAASFEAALRWKIPFVLVTEGDQVSIVNQLWLLLFFLCSQHNFFPRPALPHPSMSLLLHHLLT